MKDATNSVYIPQLDAKDLYIAGLIDGTNGYSVKYQSGEYNTRKFAAALDYSLDMIKLDDVAMRRLRRKMVFKVNGKGYTTAVINVTFKYAVKEYNRIRPGVYAKVGYNPHDEEFDDGIYMDDGVICGVKVDTPVEHPIDAGKFFMWNEVGKCYQAKTNITTLNTVADLRRKLYSEGFLCDGIHYVRWKRSAGSSRVGKCLFINEDLIRQMHIWEDCGLKVTSDEEINLAGYESSISLTSSSIIDTLEIQPNNILVIDDYTSKFVDHAVAVELDEENNLMAHERDVTIKNSIWDGQSLMDSSLFGDYSQYGMLLLRNRFFKSACFNTNLQEFFEANGITDVSQLNGYTTAIDIKDIKLITTPSSIKYAKFSSVERWLELLDPTFGIVKHDKPTPYFDGRLVQTHYQLLNTLQMTKREVTEFLKPSMEYIEMIKTDPDVLRFHIKHSTQGGWGEAMLSLNDLNYKLIGLNRQYTETKQYFNFLTDLIRSMLKDLRHGKVLVNGNYSTLVGNPMEMLYASIGRFDGKSLMGIGNVHSYRFPYNTRILGSRSPHVTCGNVWLPYNKQYDFIDQFFNFTNEIVCVNSIEENLLERLSGADFDSDTVMLTDNPILVGAAARNYNNFAVPTRLIEAVQINKKRTSENLAELDIKTSINKIGEIINLSQELNSRMWDKLNKGATYDDVRDIYCDIAMLDVLSNLEIDAAKKEFPVNNTAELKKLKIKYSLKDDDGRQIKPNFFGPIASSKGYFDRKHKVYKAHETTMDFVQAVLRKCHMPKKKEKFASFTSVLKYDEYKWRLVSYDQGYRIINRIRKYHIAVKSIWRGEGTDEVIKYDLAATMRREFMEKINKTKFNGSTLMWLLRTSESFEYRDIGKTLLLSLFAMSNVTLLGIIRNSQEPQCYLKEDPAGDICIFDYKYTKKCSKK